MPQRFPRVCLILALATNALPEGAKSLLKKAKRFGSRAKDLGP